jgi:hypothetical protein
MAGGTHFRTVEDMRKRATKAPIVARDGKLRAMAELPLFGAASSRDLITMGRLFDTSIVPAGVTFERQGITSGWLLILLDGVAVVHCGVRAAHVLRAGTCWGQSAFFDVTVRSHTVTALTDVTLLSLDRPSFAALQHYQPAIAAALRTYTVPEEQTDDVIETPPVEAPIPVGVR